jgi:Acetyltransferase (GNAT) domain
MNEKVRLLAIDDPLWKGFINNNPHDIYHNPTYCSICADSENASAQAIFWSDGEKSILLPVLLRKLPSYLNKLGEYLDICSPYGYPGPICTSTPELFDERVANDIKEFLRKENIISLFIRHHPLLPNKISVKLLGKELKFEGETIYIDLNTNVESLFSSLIDVHKRHIKKLQKLGVTVRFDNWKNLPAFIKGYYETMKRVNARDYYFFDERYFQNLIDKLPEYLHLASAFTNDGQYLGGVLFFESCGVIQYHLASTPDSAVKLSPSKLLIYSIAEWGIKNNKNFLHLGGGVGAKHDALFWFKAGFSNLRSEFHSHRIVVNEDVYNELTLKAQSLFSQKLCPNYFPNYRAQPISSKQEQEDVL